VVEARLRRLGVSGLTILKVVSFVELVDRHRQDLPNPEKHELNGIRSCCSKEVGLCVR
jgi:hypothetical protein